MDDLFTLPYDSATQTEFLIQPDIGGELRAAIEWDQRAAYSKFNSGSQHVTFSQSQLMFKKGNSNLAKIQGEGLHRSVVSGSLQINALQEGFVVTPSSISAIDDFYVVLPTYQSIIDNLDNFVIITCLHMPVTKTQYNSRCSFKFIGVVKPEDLKNSSEIWKAFTEAGTKQLLFVKHSILRNRVGILSIRNYLKILKGSNQPTHHTWEANNG